MKKYYIYVILLFLSLTFLFGKDSKSLSIVFTGDVLLDRGVRRQIEKTGSDKIFKGVQKLFKSSDYTIVNLECPVTYCKTPLMKKYIFRGEPKWLNSLKRAGITHCNLANNHSNDQGRDGLVETVDNLRKNNLIPVGYGKTQDEALKPVIIKNSGIRAAIFSSVLIPLENWMYLPDRPGPCQATIHQLIENIRIYKKKHNNDKIIVILHWGREFSREPDAIQKKDAGQLIEAGADAIIGHHPHVIQKMESINGKPVFYSLGNFVFDQKREDGRKGLAVRLIICRNKLKYKSFKINIKKCYPVLN